MYRTSWTWCHNLGVFVNKANGYKQQFDRGKVVATCLRMGATPEVAAQIAEKVERDLYEGISTGQILQMIFRYLRSYKPAVKYRFDLRRALSLMEPKPEFETFIRVLLAHSGFEVEGNRVLRGKCGEHEVDALEMPARLAGSNQ